MQSFCISPCQIPQITDQFTAITKVISFVSLCISVTLGTVDTISFHISPPLAFLTPYFHGFPSNLFRLCLLILLRLGYFVNSMNNAVSLLLFLYSTLLPKVIFNISCFIYNLWTDNSQTNIPRPNFLLGVKISKYNRLHRILQSKSIPAFQNRTQDLLSQTWTSSYLLFL